MKQSDKKFFVSLLRLVWKIMGIFAKIDEHFDFLMASAKMSVIMENIYHFHHIVPLTHILFLLHIYCSSYIYIVPLTHILFLLHIYCSSCTYIVPLTHIWAKFHDHGISGSEIKQEVPRTPQFWGASKKSSRNRFRFHHKYIWFWNTFIVIV